MAGGDLRLNNRKLKVKHYHKIFLILLRLTLLHLTWVTNYTLLSSYSDFKIMHPDNTVICQVKISRAAMKRLKGCKAAKHLKGKKIIFFLHISKASVSTGAFFFFFLIICFKTLENLP
jgi:large subunit ribosomal protein L25